MSVCSRTFVCAEFCFAQVHLAHSGISVPSLIESLLYVCVPAQSLFYPSTGEASDLVLYVM